MTDSPRFKVALVTGASQGIGAAVSTRLAKEVEVVVLVARNIDRLAKVKEDIEEAGGRAVVVACDTSVRQQVVEMAEKVKREVGVPDILVNNAGIYCIQDFCDKDYDAWDRMVGTNIKGYLYIIGEFLVEMKARGSGHIVNISSDSERFPWPGLTVYTGTKFFWAGASEALRKELTGTGVKVTNVLPGWVWTEGLKVLITDEENQRLGKQFGMGDLGDMVGQQENMLSTLGRE